jgi:hypothetical protein
VPLSQDNIATLKKHFEPLLPTLLLREHGDIVSIESSYLRDAQLFFKCAVKVAPVAEMGMEKRNLIFPQYPVKKGVEAGDLRTLSLKKAIEPVKN